MQNNPGPLCEHPVERRITSVRQWRRASPVTVGETVEGADPHGEVGSLMSSGSYVCQLIGGLLDSCHV
jgi:hypothetical protein